MTLIIVPFDQPPGQPSEEPSGGAARRPERDPRRELGARGEDVAAAYLTSLGMEILDRNWRGRDGEIDIVALAAGTLVIVEVKTRSGDGFGPPAGAVTARKYARLRRLAAQWLDEHEVRAGEVRIDVVSVRPVHSPGERDGQAVAEIEHIAGAFR